MKRVIISSLYPPYVRGGAERIAAERAEHYRAGGDEVTVIALRPWAGWGSWRVTPINQNGIEVYRFFALNLFSYININTQWFGGRLTWHLIDVINPHSWWVIRRLLRQFKPDEVEVHVAKGLGYSIFSAIRSTKISWRLVLHDVQYVVPSGLLLVGQEKILERSLIRWYAAVCRWLIGSPSEVLSPSRWLLDFYMTRGFFKQSNAKVELAFGALPPVKQLNLAPEHRPVRLLFVGQVETHKGIEWLIQKLNNYELKITPAGGGSGFAGNYELGRDFHLDIVGDGSRLVAVKQLVAGDERFTVWGRMSPAKLPEFFATADFTVVPSRCYENAPTVIAESLRAGVPVIAPPIGGIPELVVEGQNAWLIAGDGEL